MTKTYAEFRPTQFDSKGLNLPDRQDWLVCPVSHTRDSGCLDESNFYSVLKDLGGESDTIEVHRFGHWGPGWFEIILAHPSRAADVDAWEAALASYPVADEMDLSDRECAKADEVWAACSLRDRINAITRYGYGSVSLFAARKDTVPHNDGGLDQYLSGD